MIQDGSGSTFVYGSWSRMKPSLIYRYLAQNRPVSVSLGFWSREDLVLAIKLLFQEETSSCSMVDLVLVSWFQSEPVYRLQHEPGSGLKILGPG